MAIRRPITGRQFWSRRPFGLRNGIRTPNAQPRPTATSSVSAPPFADARSRMDDPQGYVDYVAGNGTYSDGSGGTLIDPVSGFLGDGRAGVTNPNYSGGAGVPDDAVIYDPGPGPSYNTIQPPSAGPRRRPVAGPGIRSADAGLLRPVTRGAVQRPRQRVEHQHTPRVYSAERGPSVQDQLNDILARLPDPAAEPLATDTGGGGGTQPDPGAIPVPDPNPAPTTTPAQPQGPVFGAGALETNEGGQAFEEMFTAAAGGRFSPGGQKTIGPVVTGDPVGGQPGGTEELVSVTGADEDTQLNVQPVNPQGMAAQAGGAGGGMTQQVMELLEPAITAIIQKLLGGGGGNTAPTSTPQGVPPPMPMPLPAAYGGAKMKLPRYSTGGTITPTEDVTDPLVYRKYDPAALGGQPFITKLKGQQDTVPFQGFSAPLSNPQIGVENMPSLLNLQTFRDLYPSEQDQTQSLYDQGLKVDFRDIMERSRRAVPGGFAPQFGMAGFG